MVHGSRNDQNRQNEQSGNDGRNSAHGLDKEADVWDRAASDLSDVDGGCDPDRYGDQTGDQDDHEGPDDSVAQSSVFQGCTGVDVHIVLEEKRRAEAIFTPEGLEASHDQGSEDGRQDDETEERRANGKNDDHRIGRSLSALGCDRGNSRRQELEREVDSHEQNGTGDFGVREDESDKRGRQKRRNGDPCLQAGWLLRPWTSWLLRRPFSDLLAIEDLGHRSLRPVF